LLEIAKYCRGNARSAALMGGQQGVSNYCASLRKKDFKMADVSKLVEILDLFPLGFSRMEVEMLRAISKQRATSLTALAAKSGLSKPAQQDIEKCFLRYGFIEIEAGHGRSITSVGQQYLKTVEGR
jgi:Holliday junction resolvasome RuvABC ATP-dependent DNA helicase subunit